jgi:hypothetical protein
LCVQNCMIYTLQDNENHPSLWMKRKNVVDG